MNNRRDLSKLCEDWKDPGGAGRNMTTVGIFNYLISEWF